MDGYAENPGDLSWKGLEDLGELAIYGRMPKEQVVERIGQAEAVYINRTPISAQAIKSCPNLRFVGVLTTGYNIVDTHATGEARVAVSNIPSYGTGMVTQYAIALLLELCRHVDFHADCAKTGGWTRCKDWCFQKYPLIELAGETMGIIGFERIGRRTAVIAETLGIKVLAYDRYQDKDLETDNRRYTDLEELLTCSDTINLHCLLFPETEKIINRQTTAKTKRGVLIINTPRGELVEEADLREGPDSGKVGGTAMDVVLTKPIQEGNPLLGAKNILITPHIAQAPRESRQGLVDIAVEDLMQFVAGTPQYVVDRP